MTTTISIRIAGEPSAGPGGDGTNGRNRRFGLKGKVVAGVAILGCATALTFGVVRTDDAAQRQPQTPPRAMLLPAGTDDLATAGCIGTAEPFGCQAGQSLAGTDDFATSGCVGTVGPFACTATLPVATYGTDDLATNGCVGTAGPFACPSAYRVSAPSERDPAGSDDEVNPALPESQR